MNVPILTSNRSARTLKSVLAKALPAVLLAAVAFSASAQDNQNMSPAALVQALQGGGHVVFMRHGSTETDYADQVTAEMGNCATQRVLSEAGWAEAKHIGAAFKRLGIPVGDVVSSEYCRAWKSADLAFGSYSTNADLNFEPAEEFTEEQFSAMRERITPHMSKAPKKGNTILVGHDDPFEAATGIYPEPMGIIFVLEPKGNGTFEILGSITPNSWDDIN